MMARTGCEVSYFGAYNTVLAPLAFALRLTEKVVPLDFGNQERRPTALVNTVLAWLFSLERHVARRALILFGLSHVIRSASRSRTGHERHRCDGPPLVDSAGDGPRPVGGSARSCSASARFSS